MCFYDTVLKCILSSMTLRTVKLKPLEYFVNALHCPFSIPSWRNNISWISIFMKPYFLRKREKVIINIVVVVLPSVLLNCSGLTICLVELLWCLQSVLLNLWDAHHLSCWIAGVLIICTVKLLQCFPSFLLNCWGTYHQSCWTATMLTICPVEPLGSALITWSCVESPAPKAAYQKVKHSSS